jgi:chemotaxis protein CheX
METEYLRPFVDGVTELVSTMLQSHCCVAPSNEPLHADVSGIIHLQGNAPVKFALSFPRTTATKMVAQLLALDEAEVDDAILGDGIGEMANIVAGVAKSRLSNEDCPLRLSLPSVIVASGHVLPFVEQPEVAHLRLVSDLGEFSLRVCPPPPKLCRDAS